MTIQEKAIEQLERISSHLSAIGEKEDYTDIAIKALEIWQTQWIPCSERLPELDEEACSKDVLISLRETTRDLDECQEVHIAKIAYYDDNAISSDGIYMDTEGWVLSDGSTLTTDEVIAWMPLPGLIK
jgi:hypothetical protein